MREITLAEVEYIAFSDLFICFPLQKQKVVKG